MRLGSGCFYVRVPFCRSLDKESFYFTMSAEACLRRALTRHPLSYCLYRVKPMFDAYAAYTAGNLLTPSLTATRDSSFTVRSERHAVETSRVRRLYPLFYHCTIHFVFFFLTNIVLSLIC